MFLLFWVSLVIEIVLFVFPVCGNCGVLFLGILFSLGILLVIFVFF